MILSYYFLDLDDCDAAGHEHGWFTSPYLQQVQLADQRIGKILDFLEKKNWMKDTLILIVTDHGGGGGNLYDHGVNHPKDMTIFFACCGPFVKHCQLSSFYLADIPAIILYAFDIPQPDGWKGKVPIEIQES